ncbi:glycosyltransferase, partial [Nostoc sp. CHAB 5834]|nr:glycosyltransferase [Nostoc sp. CHAB 5834]
ERILALLPQPPSIIFVHWVTDFINARVIHELKRLTNATIYWLMIDNAPLTGGCHYPWSCKGYQHNCSACPAIVSKAYRRLAAQNLAFKQTYLPADLHLITFSKSDYVRAKSSALFKSRSVLQWLGLVDDEIFGLGDRQAARTYFGLSADEPVLFFGAASLAEKRKGMQLLLNALNLDLSQSRTLLIAGEYSASTIPGNVKQVGYLSETELILAYQAADVFICPSVEDSGPMMINQSLMCGTPVVAFDMGVAQDLVVTGRTGYLARLGDAHDLALGIDHVLNRDVESRDALRSQCRTMALELYGRTAFVNRLLPLLAA